MEYAELKLYDLQGGDTFTNKHIKKEGETLNSNDKDILRLYKKKIIEQRQMIQELEQKVKELTKK
jgi:hypothetical protein|tara:strand:- start:13644 stop:13838 length:195 start_codon:yes stop_codon:yes gene_type:complete